MSRIIITLVFLFFFSKIYSQEKYIKLPFAKGTCSTVIIENDIIANESAIGIVKESILEASVLIDKPNRKEHTFFNLTENGVIFVSLKKKIASKKQSELNDFFGIDKDRSVYVNGYLIENDYYKIASQSIIEIEVIEPNLENKLESKSLNIWTLTKKERINGCNNKV